MSRLIISALLLAATFNCRADTSVLECTRLIDVAASKVRNNQAVLIEDKRISAVGSRKDIDKALNGRSADLELALDTCLPGLMDMHVHLRHQISANHFITLRIKCGLCWSRSRNRVINRVRNRTGNSRRRMTSSLFH